jgi:hypothetical protein
MNGTVALHQASLAGSIATGFGETHRPAIGHCDTNNPC